MSKFWSICIFILVTELCERFAYYGLTGSLVIFLTRDLGFTSVLATELTGLFGAVVYVTPVLGAYLADAHWGRYKTILFFCLWYLLGLLCTTAGAWPTSPCNDTPPHLALPPAPLAFSPLDRQPCSCDNSSLPPLWRPQLASSGSPAPHLPWIAGAHTAALELLSGAHRVPAQIPPFRVMAASSDATILCSSNILKCCFEPASPICPSAPSRDAFSAVLSLTLVFGLLPSFHSYRASRNERQSGSEKASGSTQSHMSGGQFPPVSAPSDKY